MLSICVLNKTRRFDLGIDLKKERVRGENERERNTIDIKEIQVA